MKAKSFSEIVKLNKSGSDILKFNNNHDHLGRFSSGSSAGAAVASETSSGSYGNVDEFQKDKKETWSATSEFSENKKGAEQHFQAYKDFYSKYQKGTASKDNYYFDTMAEFDPMKSRPRRQPDYVSRDRNGKVSSEYWYTEDGVVRGSDHWGEGVASCDWSLKGVTSGSRPLEIEHTGKKYGKAKWEDFVHKPTVAEINGEKVMSSFHNMSEKGIITHKGTDYEYNRWESKWEPTTSSTEKSFSESDVKELNNADTELHFNPPFNITKADEDKRLVFGWALVSADKEGNELIDRQGDMVEPDDLEEGAYEYVLNFRDAGEEHIGTLRKKARMVESCVFTPEKMKAIGIPDGTIPVGWWIGFYVDDDTTWERIKDGTYRMFSIEGKAVREPVDEPLAKGVSKSLIDRWRDDESPIQIGGVSKSFFDIMKFNQNHDNLGRFSSGSGGATASGGSGLSPEHQKIAQLLSTGLTRDINEAHEYRKEYKLSIFSPEWKAIRQEAEKISEENQKKEAKKPNPESKKPKIDPKKVEEAKRAREAEIQSQESEIQKQCNVSSETARQYRETLEEWTGGTYTDIRSYQQGKSVSDSENINRMSNNLEDMIAKSNGYGGGTLYRGIMVDDSTLSALKAGSEVNMGGTSSFSTSQKMAEDFAMGGGTGKNSIVLVTDSASKAMNIEPIFKSGENEVLVSKDVKYVSKKISKKGNVYYVYMDEITGEAKSYSGTVAKTFSQLMKFNPYHDRLGRFTTGGGFMSSGYIGDPNRRAVTFSANPDTRAGAMAIARASSGNKAHPIIGQAYGGDTKVPPKQDKPKQAKPPKAKEPEKPDDPMRPKKLAGVEPGDPMDFDKADHGSTNPNYSKGGGYYVNCQTCVIANEARRRGYDVTARPKDTKQADEIAHDQRKAWIDPKTGKNPEYMPGCRDVGTAKQAKKYLDDNLKTGERYFLGHSWRGRSRSGHIITTFKDADGNVTLYDPQSGKKMTGSEVDSYLSRIKYKASSYGIKFNLGFRILRVDDKQFNTDYVDKILVKGGE